MLVKWCFFTRPLSAFPLQSDHTMILQKTTHLKGMVFSLENWYRNYLSTTLSSSIFHSPLMIQPVF